jgi:hypothetical protein
MTKERKADKLLCAAKHWQVGGSPFGIVPVCVWADCVDAVPENDRDAWASCAMSEVSALGFDIEDVNP